MDALKQGRDVGNVNPAVFQLKSLYLLCNREIKIYEMKFLRAVCVAVYMIWAGFHLKCRNTFACLFW